MGRCWTWSSVARANSRDQAHRHYIFSPTLITANTTEGTSAETLTPTATSSSSLGRGKSGPTEKVSSSSVRMTSRASTKQSPYEHPASSSSKASTRSHRECERECEDPRSSQRYIVDPHLFQMSKSVMASPTVSLMMR
ncbi:hypothetical protein AG1IA_09516 [Rhizoctonia solani AG-1 IA]|uniref:Uncharacterized protein n=1 Tax=Thanatephorus cucumeris (strain AG1-IA) TaxID=983506 RepID=L8WER9_THACA|nr:hypothetical protein AG1IA_09516 [Rhizoctonia solani AG-1 IA]